MITNSQQVSKKKQGGIALLVLVIVIALTLSAYYFSSISVVEIQVDNIEKTRNALKRAKEALINYAITHVDGNGGGIAGEYGYLPCPDSNGALGVEGNQDIGGSCGGTYKNKLGYLPWRSLDLPAIKDGSGSCLWYVVSGNYKGDMTSGLINEDTHGFFQVVNANGDILEDRVAAIIFAPGKALSAQARNHDADTHCGGDYGNQAAYLEGDGVTDNADVPDLVDSTDRFIHATLTSDTEAVPFNDHFITVTREEIWQAIMRRDELKNRLSEVTEAIAQCLAEYVNHAENPNRRFPWPAPLNVGDYRDIDNYSDVLNAASGYAGRFPLHLDDSIASIASMTGISDEYLDKTANFICSSLNMPLSAVPNVNLTDEDLEHRIILNNWKDHFFYSVSKDYALPDGPYTGCSGDCVSIEDPVGVFTDYAAIVFFSGSPFDWQSRNDPDKSNISNYLENGNDALALFPNFAGKGIYATGNPDPLISNDIMFCLTDDAVPSVVAC